MKARTKISRACHPICHPKIKKAISSAKMAFFCNRIEVDASSQNNIRRGAYPFRLEFILSSKAEYWAAYSAGFAVDIVN